MWSVLEALDRDYKREDDWCSLDKPVSGSRAAHIVQLINKHNEQKEAFLRVSTLCLYIHVTIDVHLPAVLADVAFCCCGVSCLTAASTMACCWLVLLFVLPIICSLQ